MTLLLVLLGLFSIAASGVAACRFYSYSKTLKGSSNRLSRAISYQLWGEMVMVLGTLAFTVAAHNGWLPFWSIEIQSGIRFIMFSATFGTTLLLCHTLRSMR